LANVSHAALTGSNLHEPKGAAEASANTVYRADGAGSGSWEAPLKLIERRTFSGLTSEEFTGLSGYRALWITIEGVTFSSSSIPIIQVGTSGTYRTSTYINSILNASDDDVNGTQSGFQLCDAQTYTSGFGIIQISNFNNASCPTSAQVSFIETSVNILFSSTSPSVVRWNGVGVYPTAEAHAKFKLTTTAGTRTISSGYMTVFGIE
jgi:hypothetical protein